MIDTPLTLGIAIACPPEKVADFVRDPRNLPRWATMFCRSVSRAKDAWLVETPQGLVKFRFVPDNDFGVLDHIVTLAPGREIHVPMRVIAHGTGSQVLFTLPPTDDPDIDRDSDRRAVEQDLHTLKEVLEGSAMQAVPGEAARS